VTGLLKFLVLVGILGFLAWVGYGYFSRPDVQQRLASARQSSPTAPVGAMRDLGHAIGSADERAARQIDCAGGDQSSC
jgi:hypothetical protein